MLHVIELITLYTKGKKSRTAITQLLWRLFATPHIHSLFYFPWLSSIGLPQVHKIHKCQCHYIQYIWSRQIFITTLEHFMAPSDHIERDCGRTAERYSLQEIRVANRTALLLCPWNMKSRASIVYFKSIDYFLHWNWIWFLSILCLCKTVKHSGLTELVLWSQTL